MGRIGREPTEFLLKPDEQGLGGEGGVRTQNLVVPPKAKGGITTMRSGKGQWKADFPMREEVEDYAGRMRVFIINCSEGTLGFTVRAEEEGRGGNGYEFAAYSETSPYSALGRLRQKMYRALATRHLSGSPGAYRMLHDQLSGRITSDGEGAVLLVVDGIALGTDDLVSILASREGWAFRIADR